MTSSRDTEVHLAPHDRLDAPPRRGPDDPGAAGRPATRDGETDTPPSGFLRSTASMLSNGTVRALVLVVLILALVLGVAMVWSVSRTAASTGPDGASVRPATAALVARA